MNKDKEFIRKIKESDLLNDIDKDQLIVDIEETKEKTNEIKNHFLGPKNLILYWFIIKLIRTHNTVIATITSAK